MLWIKMRNLRSTNDLTRMQAIEQLGRYSSKATVVKAVAIASVMDDSESVRLSALRILEEWRPIGAAQLVSIAHSGYPQHKIRAAVNLTHIDKSQAVEVCALLLSSINTRIEAAQLLEGLADPRSTRPLLEAVRGEDKDVKFRMAISKTLTAIGSGAVPVLCEVLRDGSPSQQYLAAQALGEIGDVRAFEPIMGVLGKTCQNGLEASCQADAILKIVGNNANSIPEDHMIAALRAVLRLNYSGECTYSAIFLLGRFEGPTATKILIDALLNQVRKPGMDFTRHARRLVAALRVRSYSPANIEEEIALSLGAGNWERLIEIGTPAVGALLTQFGNKDARQALVRIGDKACVPALIRMLEHSRSWDEMREAAEALQQIGDAQSLAPLLRALTRRDFVFELGDYLVGAISGVLKRQVEAVSVEDLRAAAALPERLKEFRDDSDNGGSNYRERIFDCAAIITLARMELQRRRAS